MIRLCDVTYSYSSESGENLKNVNLSVKAGEFVVLTGKSGCGKTTVIRLINGLATKFYEGRLTGKVLVNQIDISELPLWQIGKTVGSIFQDPRSQFFASITEDEIAFGCENYGFEKSLIESRIKDAVERIDGEKLCGKELYPMSSGEKQKIAIASVYAVNPQIYVFDEPSANLDMASVIKLQELMGLLKANGHTVIVAEHRLYYLTDLADRFIYMQNGMFAQEFGPGEIKHMPEQQRISLGLRAGRLEALTKTKADEVDQEKPSVEIQNLEFSYGKTRIFSGLNLTVYPGDIIALTGNNGVGKSTLSHILCGLLKEQRGMVLYSGKPVAKGKRKRRAYFVMNNTDCQLFGESIEEELISNQKEDAPKGQIEEILTRYGLWDLKDKHPASLSGGQKQRLTLAVADVIDSDILILDEPTSGLDGENMRGISAHLKNLSQKGRTIFVITHDYEFAASTCNRTVRLMDGCCQMDFSVQDQFQKLLPCMLYERQGR